MIKLYDSLSEAYGKNLLFIAFNDDLAYWWMTYYGRDNVIYGLPETVDDTYFKDSKFDRTDIAKIPNDVIIFWSPNVYNMVTPVEKSKECAAVLQTVNSNTKTTVSNKFEISVFSKQEETSNLVLTMSSVNIEKIEVSIDGKIYNVQDKEQFVIPYHLAKAGQVLSIDVITSNANLQIYDWKLEIR